MVWCSAVGLILSSSPAGAAPPPATPPADTPPPATAPLSTDSAAPPHHCDKQSPNAKFRITLPKDAELDDLVHWMTSISCRRFVWEPGLRRGKVTILAADAVTLHEAFAVFHAALETMGLAIEPHDGFEKIVESGSAAGRVVPVYEPGKEPPEDDRWVTQIIRTGTNTADIVALVTALKSKTAAVQNVDDLVILTDTGANVRRILKIVEQLDDPELATERVYFRQLDHAQADSVADTVRQLFGEADQGKTKARTEGSSGSASASRVIVDTRTNTVVVVATTPHWDVIKPLIDKLDVALPGGSGRINVVRVVNADVERIAEVLNALSGGVAPKDAKTPAAVKSLGEGLQGEIRVTADPDTRSLVVMASPSDFIAVERVIQELDRERRQVYIEVFLLELSTDKTLQLGASAHFGSGVGADGVGFASSQQGDASSFALSPSVLSGLAAGVIGPSIPGSRALTGTDLDIPSFGVVIQALQTDGDVNFVADTHIYTADNKKGKIEVGGTRPTIGATQQIPVSGGVLNQQTVERIKAALSLEVTPHVHDSRTVSLDIKLDNESFGAADELGIPTNSRKLELEHVLARDDQPLVLGGLVQERETISQTEVPGLGKIPLLGWMFKSKKRRTEKVNMLMILVPHILETPEDARRIHTRRLQERLEFLERHTAFKRRDLDTHVNYGRKSGLLSSVHAESVRMRTEARERAAAQADLDVMPISGDLGLAPARPTASAARPEPATPRPTPQAKPAAN
jgi:general secretion pathway protein D